ncbi:MAG: hypothetical protein Kow00121_68860 [Elainellaceae cyanobacterium]
MDDSMSLKRSVPGLGAWVRRCSVAISSLALGLSVVVATTNNASAQAAYGSYIGIGGAVGVTDSDNGDSASGGLIAVRYRFLEVPISMRGQLLISDSSAFVPTISYDIPLNWQTTAYLGAGAAIQDSDTNNSPLGNQTAFVIQPGVDYVFPDSNLVVFGNAIIAFDAYKESNDTAASIQAGVGVNFGR